MEKRPNILFLMSDQHRYDVTGFAGNSIVRTPNLDRLASDGTVFTNAYTPSPVCIPARQCMMAGQLPETCDCRCYGEDLASGYDTFSRQFARYAYQAVAAGKLHHMGTDQMQGWTQRVAPDAHVGDRYVPGRIDEEFARYKPAPGTGKWSNQREVEEARGVVGPGQDTDRLVTDGALTFLDRYFSDPLYKRPQSHRPLLMKVSYIQPHYPFFTDPERFAYYLDKVPVYDEKPCDHPVLSLSQQGKPVHVDTEAIRRTTAAYYGMIDQIDTYYGQVLDKLRALGQNLDEWIVVYTSDHGDMLGQHGIWEKTRFYEASVRVPLIIRWPKRFKGARTVTENVNLCDLYATLCDLAGLDVPEGLDSRSLMPLLDGDASGWNDESVSQFAGKHLMIKQGNLKYQYYGDDGPEVLFDLAADPEEKNNAAERPEYADAMARFRTRCAELNFGPDADPDYVNAGY